MLENNFQCNNINSEEFKSSYKINRKINWDNKRPILPKINNITELFICNKTKKLSNIKTLRYTRNDTGKMRHFTPAAQEWHNGIYSYNKNYIKLLPNIDITVSNILKAYFNFTLDHKNKRKENRYRKLSSNKTFVGRSEIKHNNNVVITTYIYNAEQLHLRSLILNEAKSLFYPKKKLIKVVNINESNKNIITYKRPFTIYEHLNVKFKPFLPDHFLLHKKICFELFWKRYVKLLNAKELKEQEKKDQELGKILEMKYKDKKDAKTILDYFKLKMINFNNVSDNNRIKTLFNNVDKDTSAAIDNLNYKELKFKDKIEVIFLRDFFNINNDTTYRNFIDSLLKFLEINNPKTLIEFKQEILKIKVVFNNLDFYMNIAKNNYLKKFYSHVYVLMISTVKFKRLFASKLLYLLENIYKKKVELNIVNLNRKYLNTDIYTQIVALKLKDRNNNLFRVLRWSLNEVNLPNISRMTEKENTSNKNEYLINKIRNTYISSMFNNINLDPLNNLLLSFFSGMNNLEIDIKKRLYSIKRSVSLYQYIISTLKHVKLAGIRVEAKGRLTRRFTASRSVFKVKWKGGLKNVDSSFKGLSAVMLRGDRKSNVEYSIISSKNRNGAYGVKGWIANK